MTVKDELSETEKELNKIKREIYKGFFALGLVLAGLVLTFVFYGWKLTLATLLIGWGNNIAFNGLYQKKEDK